MHSKSGALGGSRVWRLELATAFSTMVAQAILASRDTGSFEGATPFHATGGFLIVWRPSWPMKPENACTFLGTSCLVYVTPEGLSDVMVIGTCTGAQDGPPTTMLAMTGTLMGAATGAAAWCVSWRCLVTEGGTRALLTIVCTFTLPLPLLLVFFFGVPDGAPLEALGADCQDPKNLQVAFRYLIWSDRIKSTLL